MRWLILEYLGTGQPSAGSRAFRGKENGLQSHGGIRLLSPSHGGVRPRQGPEHQRLQPVRLSARLARESLITLLKEKSCHASEVEGAINKDNRKGKRGVSPNTVLSRSHRGLDEGVLLALPLCFM